jgi:dienelactone hydrolase
VPSTKQEINFYSDWIKLSGYLYLPENRRGKLPGIICCHGYSGMKDLHLLPVPEWLVENDYVCLAFDHRGFGKSEGIRGRNVPMEQVRDIRNAITYLQQQPQVDPDRRRRYPLYSDR